MHAGDRSTTPRSEPFPAEPGESPQFLGFRLAGLACAIPLQAVQQIVPMTLLSRPPGLPDILEGFLNLRGAHVPVVQMRRLFDFPPAEPGLHTPVIIMQTPQNRLGLWVDSVTSIIRAPEHTLTPLPCGQILNNCAQARIEGQAPVHLLCPERILLEQERQAIAQLHSALELRLRQLGQDFR